MSFLSIFHFNFLFPGVALSYRKYNEKFETPPVLCSLCLLKVLIGFTMVNVVFLIFYTHSTFTSFIRFDNTYKHDTNVEERQNHKWVAVDFEGNLLENEKIRRKQYLKVQNRSQSNRRKSFMTGYSTNIGKQVIIVKGNGSQKDRLKEYINEVKSQRIKHCKRKRG